MPLPLSALVALALSMPTQAPAQAPRLELKLEGARVCGSDEVKVKVPFGAQSIESPLANATILVARRQNQTVGIGKVKPGLVVVTVSGKDFTPGSLAVLVLPERAGNCFTLQALKTQEVPVSQAQASAWAKFLEGYSKLTESKDVDEVHRRFKNSLGSVAVSAGATFVSCAVFLSTAAAGAGGFLVWSCAGNVADLAASLASKYFLAVNEVLHARGTLDASERDLIKKIIQTAMVAQSVANVIATGILNGKGAVKALLSEENALTVTSYVSDLTLSESVSGAIGGGADLTKKYLYVHEALQKVK